MGTCNVEAFTLGPFETNCYLLWPADSSEAWIIDASFEPAPIIADIRARELRPAALLLTHAHVDHIAGVKDIRGAFPDVPIWIHEAERLWLTDPERNLSAFSGMPVSAPEPDRLLRHGEHLRLGGLEFEVRHTPGHSPGGITLYQAQLRLAVVGDALFAGSVGRTDFPGSDPKVLARSIREQLYTLPDDTRVLSGHGPPTTIGRERASNPFVRG